MTNTISCVCIDCGKKFTINKNEFDYIEKNGFEVPKRCKQCRKNRKSIYTTKICIDCDEEFTISSSEHNFYSKNNLIEPKRCQKCREKKKIHTRGKEIND